MSSPSSPTDSATLYLVATPIGNLSDMSPRARSVLGRVRTAYAEDTRRTLKLVRHFDLDTRLVSLHEHNERERIDEALAGLEAGEDLALVTDAGTPSVSDPGALLVRAVARAGHRVVSIPGPSAVLAALAVSGFGADEFAFLGFPPRKGSARREWLRRCAALEMTLVAFESPNRLARLLAELAAAGLEATPACVCRELTKVHEEVRRGTVAALADYYGEAEVRGEVTLVLGRTRTTEGRGRSSGARSAAEDDGVALDATARAAAIAAARAGASTPEIVAALRADFGLARNAAYQIALEAGQGAEDGSEDERDATEE
ncbi:MAG: 16S rRNA (cytidine(1402)-2'-O)-methyltransferase [Gemmatimonadota bacterium]